MAWATATAPELGLGVQVRGLSTRPLGQVLAALSDRDCAALAVRAVAIRHAELVERHAGSYCIWFSPDWPAIAERITALLLARPGTRG